MKRLFALAVTAALAGVVAVAPAASKGHHHATKVKRHEAPIYLSSAFTCSGGASDTTGTVYGTFKAKLKDKGTTVAVDVKLRGADANSSYGIYVNQDPGGCPTTQVATLTTDGHGNGSLNLAVARVSGATVAWVSAVDTSQTLRSTAVSLSK
jgi:hypothetical protein